MAIKEQQEEFITKFQEAIKLFCKQQRSEAIKRGIQVAKQGREGGTDGKKI